MGIERNFDLISANNPIEIDPGRQRVEAAVTGALDFRASRSSFDLATEDQNILKNHLTGNLLEMDTQINGRWQKVSYYSENFFCERQSITLFVMESTDQNIAFTNPDGLSGEAAKRGMNLVSGIAKKAIEYLQYGVTSQQELNELKSRKGLYVGEKKTRTKLPRARRR